MPDVMRCPTVAIVSLGAPGGYIVINESDREPHHELWNGTVSDKLKIVPHAEAPGTNNGESGAEDGPLRVSKGPRGKYYLRMGKEYTQGPFETEEEADAALNGPFDK